ncbi:MAG TPA: DUF3653 domain-containing protein [Xylella sp.]
MNDHIPDQTLTDNWEGFAFVKGYLITPERKKLAPYQLAWLSLTCTLAREWQKMMEQGRADIPAGGHAASVQKRPHDTAQKTLMRYRTCA